jgi:glycosyltransferase involved in cell wall biosynthesis
MRDLSVVVPTHNRRAFLPALLAGLAAQRYPAERWELIIVDDGSTDGAHDWLAREAGPRPLHTTRIHQPPGGPAVARNTGARVATGRALLFLDDDLVPTPDLVAEHVAAHRADPDAVVIGHVSGPAAGSPPWVAWEEAEARAHYARLASGERRPGPRDFSSGACSVGSGLFHAVGGFPNAPAHGADHDLGYRLAEAGAVFYYRPAAECVRVGRESFEDWVGKARAYGQSDARLASDEGHVDLRGDIMRSFHQRRRPGRLLTRLSAAAPALEAPAIGLLHAGGLLTHRLGVSSATAALYSAIYDLAYWQALSAGVGRPRFWAGVAEAQVAPPAPCAADATQSVAGA